MAKFAVFIIEILSWLKIILDGIEIIKEYIRKFNNSENKLRFIKQVSFSLIALLTVAAINLYNTSNQVTVYDTTDVDSETAIKILERGGFIVDPQSDFSSSVDKGLVISQKPTGGTSAKRGSTITIWVSEGKKVITVTLDPQEGFIPEKILSISYHSYYQKLPIPTKKHYSFVGWYTDSNSGIKVTEDSFVSSEDDHTLYAHWIENPLSDWVEVLPDYVTENPDLYDIASKTQYRFYKVDDATYYSEKPANYSPWQDEFIAGNDEMVVETRQLFQYIKK